MPIQVWYDDSGSPSSNNWLFMHAGLVASAEAWAMFSGEWKACLDEAPAINYFKMREAMHGEGQFDRIKMAARIGKSEKLAALLVRYALAGHHASVDTRVFPGIFSNDGPFRHHYVVAALYAVFGACLDIYARGFTTEPFEAFFDTAVTYSDLIKVAYQSQLPLASVFLRPEAKILPSDIIFRDDKEFLPLQGSDMLATCLRHCGEKRLDGREDFNPVARAVDIALDGLSLSDHSQSITAQRLRQLSEVMDRVVERISKMDEADRRMIRSDPERLMNLMAEVM